ncbi:MAG: Fe-S cluster assembly protein SufB, partial [Acidocella sp.]|nr:Fe-S cluster assembly protein SufB [Acidocella sp.]
MAAVTETLETVDALAAQKYKYGFETNIAMDAFPKGLNEDIVRLISAKKDEPEWMLEWRLKAYALWRTMEEPDWARIKHPPIDYENLYYYAAPSGPAPKSLEDVDP